jgi:hypothetical protein
VLSAAGLARPGVLPVQARTRISKVNGVLTGFHDPGTA